MAEDEVVIIPEGVGLLLEDAPAGDGGGLRPRMHPLKRKILEVIPHLGGIRLDEVLAEHLGFHFAVRAFQVAKGNDRHWGARSAEGGLELRRQLVQIRFERVGGDVVDAALDYVLAILGDIQHHVLELLALREADAHLLEVRQHGRLGVAHGHLELRLDHVQVAHVGFQRRLVEGGLLRSIGGAENESSKKAERKGSKHNALHCNR